MQTQISKPRKKSGRKNEYLQKIEQMGVKAQDLGVFSYCTKSKNKDLSDKVAKNRESAIRSRRRKEVYIHILEERLANLTEENQRLKTKIQQLNSKMAQTWRALSESEKSNQVKLGLLQDIKKSNGLITPEIRQSLAIARRDFAFDGVERRRQFESAHDKAVDIFLPILHRFLLMNPGASDCSCMLQAIIYDRKSAFQWAQEIKVKFKFSEAEKRESQFLAMRFRDERARVLQRLCNYQGAKEEMYAAAKELNRVVKGFTQPLGEEVMQEAIVALIQHAHRPELLLSTHFREEYSPEDFLNRVLV